MRKLHIFTLLAAFLIIIGCTEEKDFKFDVNKTANVNFKAINLTVGSPDSARSIKYDGGFYEEWHDYPRQDKISIDYYRNNEWDGNEDWMGVINIDLESDNVLWSGGYNEIEFTFLPSCPEEKEAKFTMPDGQVYNVTADNPTFTWTVSKEKWTDSQLWDYDRLIATAESTYKRGGDTVTARGYIIISLRYEGSSVRYNPDNGKWYWDDWMNNPVLTLYGNIDFTVENLTVGSIDSAVSRIYTNDYFEMEGRDENGYFTFDLYDIVDSTPELSHKDYPIYLYEKNALWAAGDNQLKITFKPSESEPEDTKLFLPDGKDAYLTASDSVYIWTLDKEAMIDPFTYNDRLIIRAENVHSGNNVTRVNHGFVAIDVASYIRYDSALKLWIYDEWTGQTRSKAILRK